MLKKLKKEDKLYVKPRNFKRRNYWNIRLQNNVFTKQKHILKNTVKPKLRVKFRSKLKLKLAPTLKLGLKPAIGFGVYLKKNFSRKLYRRLWWSKHPIWKKKKNPRKSTRKFARKRWWNKQVIWRNKKTNAPRNNFTKQKYSTKRRLKVRKVFKLRLKKKLKFVGKISQKIKQRIYWNWRVIKNIFNFHGSKYIKIAPPKKFMRKSMRILTKMKYSNLKIKQKNKLRAVFRLNKKHNLKIKKIKRIPAGKLINKTNFFKFKNKIKKLRLPNNIVLPKGALGLKKGHKLKNFIKHLAIKSKRGVKQYYFISISKKLIKKGNVARKKRLDLKKKLILSNQLDLKKKLKFKIMRSFTKGIFKFKINKNKKLLRKKRAVAPKKKYTRWLAFRKDRKLIWKIFARKLKKSKKKILSNQIRQKNMGEKFNFLYKSKIFSTYKNTKMRSGKKFMNERFFFWLTEITKLGVKKNSLVPFNSEKI